jgi:glycosyltransferase involved in cell wall biosynthesis
MGEELLKIYSNVDKHKLEYLPNGYDEEDFDNIESCPNIFNHKEFNIVYTGTISKRCYDFDLFLKALVIVIKIVPNLKVHLIGSVDGEFKEMVQAKGLTKNIKLYGYLAHNRIISYIKSADLLLLVIAGLKLDKKEIEYDISSKVFEYIRSGSRIFALVPKNGEAANIITATNTGRIVDALSPQEVAADLIDEIFNSKKDHSPKWDEIKKYDRKNQAQTLAKIFYSLIE